MKKLILFAFSLLFYMGTSAQTLDVVAPEAVGLSGTRLANADRIIEQAINDQTIPGAVLCVERHGKIGYLKAYGNKRVYPNTEKMTTNTVFDMASCSKAMSTATCAMILIDRGQLRLLDRVDQYVPGFENWKDTITGETEAIRIINLMTHTSGLPPYAPVQDLKKKYGSPNPKAVVDWISHCQRLYAPEKGWTYSCCNYIMLQQVIEKITGQSIQQFAHDNIFAPLGMRYTDYHPTKELAALCAPTEKQADGNCLLGVVHDPLACTMMGGLSGNAGLFSSAKDVATYCAAILNGGEFKGKRILSPLAVKCMITVPRSLEQFGHTPGWGNSTPYSSNLGDLLSSQAFGHTGYTGTSIVMDPVNDVAIILLTNCVHPVDKGNVVRLRSLVANAVAGSILK